MHTSPVSSLEVEVVEDIQGGASIRRDASVAAAPVDPGGLAGWVLGILRGRSSRVDQRHLRVVETLALGGRRQLLLVTCDGERFLVGSGPDRVDTIVKVGAAGAGEESWS